jgi:hypothetical protein
VTVEGAVAHVEIPKEESAEAGPLHCRISNTPNLLFSIRSPPQAGNERMTTPLTTSSSGIAQSRAWPSIEPWF